MIVSVLKVNTKDVMFNFKPQYLPRKYDRIVHDNIEYYVTHVAHVAVTDNSSARNPTSVEQINIYVDK